MNHPSYASFSITLIRIESKFEFLFLYLPYQTLALFFNEQFTEYMVYLFYSECDYSDNQTNLHS